jgi:hypothetical protein
MPRRLPPTPESATTSCAQAGSMPQDVVFVNIPVNTQRPKVEHTFEAEHPFCRAIVRISVWRRRYDSLSIDKTVSGGEIFRRRPPARVNPLSIRTRIPSRTAGADSNGRRPVRPHEGRTHAAPPAWRAAAPGWRGPGRRGMGPHAALAQPSTTGYRLLAGMRDEERLARLVHRPPQRPNPGSTRGRGLTPRACPTRNTLNHAS